MIVARQFIAWNVSQKKTVPEGRSDPYPRLIHALIISALIGPNHTVPLRHGFLFGG